MSEKLPILRGRKFGCTQCGNCCLQDGFVYLKPEEEARIAAHLGHTVERFRSEHGARWEPDAEQYALEAKDGKGCPLLTPDRRCSVHEVKPSQCSAWPFWPEMLDDRTVWDAAKRFCPGLDAEDGRRYSRSEILSIRREQRGTG